jgi:Ca2+-dependent lipid-binding protein
VWVGNESHVFTRPEHLEELIVEVFDYDDKSDDDLIGRCTLDLREYKFEEEDVDWVRAHATHRCV